MDDGVLFLDILNDLADQSLGPLRGRVDRHQSERADRLCHYGLSDVG